MNFMKKIKKELMVVMTMVRFPTLIHDLCRYSQSGSVFVLKPLRDIFRKNSKKQNELFDKYFGKYGNCGVRYASIECGAFLQNFQLLLSEKDIYGCPLGFVDNDALLGIEEPLIYFIIN